jgi:hypothetical protein
MTHRTMNHVTVVVFFLLMMNHTILCDYDESWDCCSVLFDYDEWCDCCSILCAHDESYDFTWLIVSIKNTTTERNKSYLTHRKYKEYYDREK